MQMKKKLSHSFCHIFFSLSHCRRLSTSLATQRRGWNLAFRGRALNSVLVCAKWITFWIVLDVYSIYSKVLLVARGIISDDIPQHALVAWPENTSWLTKTTFFGQSHGHFQPMVDHVYPLNDVLGSKLRPNRASGASVSTPPNIQHVQLPQDAYTLPLELSTFCACHLCSSW